MHLPPSLLALLLVLLLPSSATAASEPPKPTNKPCTLHSPSSGSFYDLRPLQLLSSDAKDARTESWHAKGYDYGTNFTLNFCGPVIEELEDVLDVRSSSWRNVSAFYKDPKGDIISIGQQSAEPVFRGKKLVLNYTSGSLCPELDEDGIPIDSLSIRTSKTTTTSSLYTRKVIGDDDDDDDDEDESPPSRRPSPSPKPSPDPPTPSPQSTRRKSTLLSFQCDRDPLLTEHPAISFIGSLDHCTYFFEVRSRHACGGVSASNDSGSLGPGGVFGVILAIAVLVYLIGGCAYQRTVMHQRGWRQCPHYGIWAGIWGFVSVRMLFPSTRAEQLKIVDDYVDI